MAEAHNEAGAALAASGAASAAGVLTAVDEDEEGAEEAECPREFEYFSDDEEQE
jgi:26S proteasome regulatory subunit N2